MMIACADCGTVQHLPPLRHNGSLQCCRCGNVLERATGRNLDYAMALALATLLLLFPANLMPLIRVSLAGVERSSRLGSGVLAMWHAGWPLLAIAVGLQGVLLPFLRFGLLAAALSALRMGLRGVRIGVLFRWAERLDLWAMPDVFLIGAAVGYSRVAVHLAARIETGGWALIGAAFLSMVTRASLNRRAIWQAIAPPAPPPSGPVIACLSCDLVCSADDDGGRCPRCGRPLHVRTPGAMPAAAALVCAGYLLYPVANYFPMSLDYRIDQVQAHTIANGVEQLLAAGFWPIALLIFTTSIAIPLLKLVGLTWLLWSAHRGSTHRLVLKTRLYRVIDEIGRWSNVDIFTIAIFMPLMQFNGLVQVRAAVGAPAFLAVVLLTMLAVRWFDPRLLWDNARA